MDQTDVVRELTDFINRQIVGPSLAPAEQQLGSLKLRIALINLLSWLKARYRMKTMRPMTLPLDVEWAVNLRVVVTSADGLRRLFTVNDESLEFSSEVADDERQRVLSSVNDAYNPRIMT